MGTRIRSKGSPYIPSYMDLSKGPEPCVVCGDAATGLHYRCMTCEGCKGFFRRSIQKDLKYFCKGNGHCAVDKTTRNHCQQCRFRKCVREGMATDLVLNENQRIAKRHLIEENRERKKLETIRNQLRQDETHDHLTDQDHHLIHTLTHAYCHVLDVQKKPITTEVENELEDCRVVLGPHFDRIIQFASQLLPFAKLDPGDKATLLRHSCMDVLLLLVSLQFDAVQNSLLLPSGCQITEKILHSSPHYHRVLGPIFDFGASLGRIQLDNKESALVAALLIFCPDKAELVDPLAVESAQDQVLTALKRYIHDNNSSEDMSRWGKILLRIVDLRTMSLMQEEEFSRKSNLPLLAQILGTPLSL